MGLFFLFTVHRCVSSYPLVAAVHKKKHVVTASVFYLLCNCCLAQLKRGDGG